MISGHRLKDRLGKDKLLSFPARLRIVITMEEGRMAFPDQLDMAITD